MRRALIGFVIAAAACGSSSSEPPAGIAACEHFHNTAVDYAERQLTTEELRRKIREVADSAAGVAPELERQARKAVSLMTEGALPESEAVQEAFSEMSAICDEVLGR